MSFAVLEKQVAVLPQELQDNIEMYARFVINQFKNGTYKEKYNNDITSKKTLFRNCFQFLRKNRNFINHLKNGLAMNFTDSRFFLTLIFSPTFLIPEMKKNKAW